MKGILFLTAIFFNMALQANAQWSLLGEGIYNAKNPKPFELDANNNPIENKTINGKVNAITVFKDELYVGGAFQFAGVKKVNNLATWDGKKWSAVGDGVQGEVDAMCVYKGALYLAITTTIGQEQEASIAKWDGTKWSTFIVQRNVSNSVLKVYKDELYMAGNFTEIGGKGFNHIAKWDGKNWSAVGNGRDNDIFCLAEHNGELYSAGTYLDVADENERSISKWNGKEWIGLPGKMGGAISNLFFYQGNLCAGGYFASVNQSPVQFIAVNTKGVWSSLWNGTTIPGEVEPSSGNHGQVPDRAIALSAVEYNEQLYIGGSLKAVGGNGIVTFDGKTWSNLGAGVNGGVRAMAIYKGDLYVGGIFSAAGGLPANGIAKWTTSQKK